MKRPLIGIILLYIIGILVNSYQSFILKYSTIVVLTFSMLLLAFIVLYFMTLSRKKSFWENYVLSCFRVSSVTILVTSFMLGYLLMKVEGKPEELETYLRESLETRIEGSISEIIMRENGITCILEDCQVYSKEEQWEDSENSTVPNETRSNKLKGKETQVQPSKRYNTKEKIIVYLNYDKFPLLKKETFHIGYQVSFDGILSTLNPASNPGQFDEYRYYKTKDVSYKLYAKKMNITSMKIDTLADIFYQCRNWLTKQMYAILPEKEASVMNAILYGDKSMLSDEMNALYQQSGITHMMSVSGLHISLLGYALYQLLSKCKLSFQCAIYLSITFLLGYGALTGYSVSTKRAVIMFVLSLGAKILGRTYDMLSALALSALFILIQQPRELFSPGFLLSYAAVLGILLVYPVLTRFTEGLIKPIKIILNATLLSTATQLTTLPLLAYFFYELPLYAVLVNLILVPFSSFLLITSGLASLLSFFSVTVGRWLVGASYYVLKGYEMICGLNVKIPYHYLLVGKISILQIVLYYLLLCLWVLWISLNHSDKPAKKQGQIKGQIKEQIKEGDLTQRKKLRSRSLVLLLVLLPFLVLWKGDGVRITCIDVSQGDGAVIEIQGLNILMDCGSSDVKEIAKYRMVPFLKSRKIDVIDYAIVSHGDNDHISGILEIMESMKMQRKEYNKKNYNGKIVIKNLILPKLNEYDESYQKLFQLATEKGINVIMFQRGDELKWKDATIRCLHPYKDFVSTSRNSHSLVLLLTYREFDGIFTGDVEKEGELLALEELEEYVRENQLLKSDNQIELLKVAHHGSNTSSSETFLKNLRPIFSVMSAGKNNRYGHPSKDVCNRFHERGLPYAVTMTTGAITIQTDGRTMKIHRYFEK